MTQLYFFFYKKRISPNLSKAIGEKLIAEFERLDNNFCHDNVILFLQLLFLGSFLQISVEFEGRFRAFFQQFGWLQEKSSRLFGRLTCLADGALQKLLHQRRSRLEFAQFALQKNFFFGPLFR